MKLRELKLHKMFILVFEQFNSDSVFDKISKETSNE